MCLTPRHPLPYSSRVAPNVGAAPLTWKERPLMSTNTMRLSLEMNRRPMVNEFSFELARYQRKIQHL